MKIKACLMLFLLIVLSACSASRPTMSNYENQEEKSFNLKVFDGLAKIVEHYEYRDTYNKAQKGNVVSKDFEGGDKIHFYFPFAKVAKTPGLVLLREYYFFSDGKEVLQLSINFDGKFLNIKGKSDSPLSEVRDLKIEYNFASKYFTIVLHKDGQEIKAKVKKKSDFLNI